MTFAETPFGMLRAEVVHSEQLAGSRPLSDHQELLI